MKRPALILLAFLIAGSASRPARADDEAAYKAHYDRAKELVKAGDRRGGIREFEAAWAASAKPEAVYNIGVLYKKLAESGGTVEEARRAIDSFTQYIDRYRALHHVDPPDRVTVERYQAELRAAFKESPSAVAAPAPNPERPAETAKVEAPPPVDKQKEAPAPVVATTATSSSSTTDSPAVRSVEPGHPAHDSMEEESPVEKPRRSRLRTAVGATLLAVGLAVAGTGAALTAVGFSSGTGDAGGTLDRYKSSISSTNAERGAGLTLAGVGALAVVAGAVLLALPVKSSQSTTVSVAPSLGGMVVSGRF